MPFDPGTCPDYVISSYSRKLKALSHPLRLKLLCLIAREEEPCVSDLWRCLDQPQPVISQHLAILKSSGIVRSETQKTKRVYAIIDPFVRDLITRVLSGKKDLTEELRKA